MLPVNQAIAAWPRCIEGQRGIENGLQLFLQHGQDRAPLFSPCVVVAVVQEGQDLNGKRFLDVTSLCHLPDSPAEPSQMTIVPVRQPFRYQAEQLPRALGVETDHLPFFKDESSCPNGRSEGSGGGVVVSLARWCRDDAAKLVGARQRAAQTTPETSEVSETSEV